MSDLPPPYSEYPRPGFPPSGSLPSGRGPGVYFDAIKEAWQLVRADLGSWIAGTIVFFVITYAMLIPINLITAPLAPQPTDFNDLPKFLTAFALQMVFGIVPNAISQMLMVGLIAMGVRQARGEYINVGMMFDPFRRFGPMFLSSLLFLAIATVSILACGFPALFFIPVMVMMPTVAFFKEVGPVEAASITFNACKGHWAGLLGLLFVVGILSGLGVCACCVGVLVTYPIYFVTLAIHYRAFFESGPMAGPTDVLR